jgi:hypothetical protein
MNVQRTMRQLRRAAAMQVFGPDEYIAPAIGVLAIGMVAGAGLALFFAPMTGKRLREEMENKLMGLKSRLLIEAKEAAIERRNNAHLSPVTS